MNPGPFAWAVSRAGAHRLHRRFWVSSRCCDYDSQTSIPDKSTRRRRRDGRPRPSCRCAASCTACIGRSCSCCTCRLCRSSAGTRPQPVQLLAVQQHYCFSFGPRRTPDRMSSTRGSSKCMPCISTCGRSRRWSGRECGRRLSSRPRLGWSSWRLNVRLNV